MLLSSGVSINSKDKLGYTPLHFALRNGSEPVVNVLLQHGADITQTNAYGSSCNDFMNRYCSSLDIPGIDSDSHANNISQHLTDTNQTSGQNRSVHNAGITPDSNMNNATNDQQGRETTQTDGQRSSEQIKAQFWQSFPKSSLLATEDVNIEDIDLLIERAKEIRGDTSLFLQRLLNASSLGPVNEDENIILLQLESFVHQLADSMSEIDGRFAIDIELAGSNREGTKVSCPNEFDFLFKLVHFTDEFVIDEVSAQRPDHVSVRRLDVDDKESAFTEFTDRSGNLDVNVSASYFRHLLKKALSQSQSWQKHDLFIISEKCLSYIPCLTLKWAGMGNESYVDMEISVDIVPCFQTDIPPCWDNPNQSSTPVSVIVFNQLAKHGCLVLLKSKLEGFQQISVFHSELKLFQSLDPDVQNAYILAKVLRDPRICPNFKKRNTKFAIFESKLLIPSYLLKMAVFHCYGNRENDLDHDAGNVQQNNEGERIRKIVCVLFQWIERNVSENMDIPSYFVPGLNILDDYKVIAGLQNHYMEAVCKFIVGLLQD